MTDTHVPPPGAAGAGATPPAAGAGKRYWRSLDDLARTPEFVEALHREFPEGAAEHSGLADPVSRRKFLGVVASSVALAGMAGCRKPGREILPYTRRPEGVVPGLPQHYATAHERFGYGIGMLVRSHTGRPTKVEGNPSHPASLGAADTFMQAELLQIYDPARSRQVRHAGGAGHDRRAAGDHAPDEHADEHADEHGDEEPPTFDDLATAWGEVALELGTDGGAGFRVLMPPTSSPTMARLVAELEATLPAAKVVRWSPVGRDNAVAGAKLAFGRAVDTQYDFAKADVVAAFDADFLGVEAPTLAWTRSWAAGRKVRQKGDAVSRLYVAESCHTVTGSNADHRFPVSDAEIAELVFALAAELGAGGEALGQALAGRRESGPPAWLAGLAADLRAHAGKACVVVGPRQPAAVHAVAHAINAELGAVARDAGGEQPVWYTPTPAGLDADGNAELRELCDDMRNGEVRALAVLDANPVYDAPADLGFAELYRQLSAQGLTVHLGLHVDETAQVSSWHVPLAHELERWSDLRAYDGTAAVVQPLIAPLYADARSPLELLATLIQHPDLEGWELVRGTWREAPGTAGADFESRWRAALNDGVVAGTAAEPLGAPDLRVEAVAGAVGEVPNAGAPTSSALELSFRASPTLLDGRYANNPWQQELPTPLEKLTWDNAALLTRATAAELGVYNGDLIEISAGERKLSAAVWIQPGHARNAMTLYLGYGRRLPADCEVAAGCGFDTAALRSSTEPAWIRGVTVRKTGHRYTLASTQDHGVMEGRPLVREADKAAFEQDPWFARRMSPAAKLAALQGGHGSGEHGSGEHDSDEHGADEHGADEHGAGEHGADEQQLPIPEERSVLRSLWTERQAYAHGYQWGMVIDLNSCTGCNACVTACVAENNIPMVGKEQVLVGREMHWNRLDRYFSGEATQDGVPLEDEPQVVHQMVPCMQCENAPCESVCPVGATLHSPEGLNDMVYNRCIGTRYCNNNCPYKVRRFNWFDFHGDIPEAKQMAYNPDVTIRHRGVMEKCTYCVQRINAAKFQARLDDRRLQDGDVVTACQQTCPAEAITFGDINDPGAQVTRLRGNVDREIDGIESEVEGSPLNYAMLAEYNLKPRTTYLAKVRNPNPELS